MFITQFSAVTVEHISWNSSSGEISGGDQSAYKSDSWIFEMVTITVISCFLLTVNTNTVF